MHAIIFVVASLISFCGASVDFSHSTMYDIYDFRHEDEVPIPKCDNGCLIYASTMGSGFAQSPSDWDPYSENLIIHDNKKGENLTSITDLSRLFDKQNMQKTPLTITGPARISILNVNDPNDNTTWPIALYVVEKATADKTTYQIYDVLNMNDKVTVSPGITTIMCAEPFTLTANSNGAPNSVTSRLVGFDNALDGNVDQCPVAYSTPKQNPFPGFTIYVDGPLVSLYFTEQVGVQLTASMQFSPVFDLASDGFIASGGYNGCKKPANGGIQSFRSFFVNTDAIYLLTANTDKYNVSMDVEPNLDAKHALDIFDITNFRDEKVSGYVEKKLQFDNTDYFNILFNGLKGDQGFLLRYSTVAVPKPTTTTIPTTTTSTTTSTSTTQTPTTSSSRGVESMLLSFFIALTVTRML